MTLFNYSPNDYDTFIGIDVSKKSFSFTILKNNSIIKSIKIPSSPESLIMYVKKNFPDDNILFAYEAGPTGYHLYDSLISNNYHCIVVSPNSIPKPPNARVKNDRLDSISIVQQLHAGNLKPIRVPSSPYRQLRHLIKIRKVYSNQRKKARQRIKSVLLFANLYPSINLPDEKWSSRFIQSIKKLHCSESVRLRLDMLLDDLNYARNKLASLHRKIRNFVNTHSEIKEYVDYLISIPGIGFITATELLGKIGDPSQLKNVRELGCFFGLTPAERSTGGIENRGSISHIGDKEMRRMLIESAWVAIGRDKELEQFYYRILNRNNPKNRKQKAIVAVARKLTTRIYAVLSKKKRYTIH